jgi:signal peptidase I
VLAKAEQPWARAVAETCDTINFVLILAFLLVRPFVAQAFYIPSESMENTLLTGDRLIVDKFSYRLREPKKGDVVVFQAPARAADGVPGVDFIKRCVATPGDTIEVRGARLQLGAEEIGPDYYSGQGAHGYVRDALGLSEEQEIKFLPDGLLVDSTRKMSKQEIAQKLGRVGQPIVIVPGRTLINGKPAREEYVREDPSYDMAPRRLEPGEMFMLGDNRNRSKDSHIWGVLERKSVVGRATFVFWPPARAGSIR